MNAKLRAVMLYAGLIGSLSTMTCKNDDDPEMFGFTCIEMQAGEGVEGDPFAGTQKIKATMTYEPCLIDYYTKKHPEQRPDGPADAGGATFEEWKERLCNEDVERRMDCEVDSFEQTINAGGVTELYNMTITYSVIDPAGIAGRRLLWGPGPLQEYAECEAGLGPFVRFVGLGDLQGLDGAGNTLWSLQSYGATPRGKIQSVGAGCLQVPVER